MRATLEYIRDCLFPRFLGGGGSGPYAGLFNYRRLWALAVLLVGAATLTPLGLMAVTDYNISLSAAQSEVRLRTARIASNARRAISFHVAERVSALRLASHRLSQAGLGDQDILAEVLMDLKSSFGGFVDLGVIDAEGVQRGYAGPFELALRNYADQPWFAETMRDGQAVSEVFLGYRQAPHLVVAVRMARPGGTPMVLRATLDTERFNALAALDLVPEGDSFVINSSGVLQTPSRHHGKALEKVSLPVPEPSEHTEVFSVGGEDENTSFIGYAYIKGSPFILMVVKPSRSTLGPWHEMRQKMAKFLVVSATGVILVILCVATFLVSRIYLADMNRVAAMHQAEHANKMASIGRLAAGVAHEINNPLAVINEKTGLLKDLFTFRKEYAADERLIGLVDSVLASVERCGTITKRLLGFARHLDVSVETVDLARVITEVLDFLHKEAEYRGVTVNIDVAENIPDFDTDRGKLQQILLNLSNNALAAMDKGGILDISARMCGSDSVCIIVGDTGCGIAEQDLKRIFEPFFSTRKDSGGTGLGLSITYGLVRKLGGEVAVESQVGKGTDFFVTLPLTPAIIKEETCEYF